MIEMLLTGNSEPVNDEEKYLAFMFKYPVGESCEK